MSKRTPPLHRRNRKQRGKTPPRESVPGGLDWRELLKPAKQEQKG